MLKEFYHFILTLLLLQSACTRKHITSPESTDGTVTGNDGKVYTTVKIGDQWWMAENLKETLFRNGEEIPLIVEMNSWRRSTTAMMCVYDNDETLVDTLGYLYNWYAATDPRNIAPKGWHVPSDEDWDELELYLQKNGYAFDGTVDDDDDRTTGNKIGKAMTLETGWKFSDKEGAIGNPDYPEMRNITGFNAVAGGYRDSSGLYQYINWTGNYWTTADYNGANAWYRRFLYSSYKMIRDDHGMRDGFSIRCVRDDTN